MEEKRPYTQFGDLSEVPLPRRYDDSNKGTYGKVLFIGAAEGCAGAGYLASCAAYYAGCGLVKALVGEDCISLINCRLPEAMTEPLFGRGTYAPDILERGLAWATVIVIGPGLGMGTAAHEVMMRVIGEDKPKVIDADALNLLANEERIADLIKGQAVLTPHMGELSRLTGLDIPYLKAHIFDIAAEYAYNQKLVYVCKDARTVISDGTHTHMNTTGNNGMSTGGCGDVLAGLTAGLLAAGMEPYEAARSAAYIHGAAGDRAAERIGVDSMLAGDVLAEIPGVIRTIREKK